MAAVTTLPAAFVANTVLTAQQLNDLRGAFRVLQVVTATSTTTVTNSTVAFVSNGLTVNITPSATSSKIFIICTTNGQNNGGANTGTFSIFRGSTNLGIASYGMGELNPSVNAPVTLHYLDSPSSTSSLTYTMQQLAGSPTTVTSMKNGAMGSITVMEISA